MAETLLAYSQQALSCANRQALSCALQALTCARQALRDNRRLALRCTRQQCADCTTAIGAILVSVKLAEAIVAIEKTINIVNSNFISLSLN